MSLKSWKENKQAKQEIREMYKPETKNNLNRFEKNEYALQGLMQLLIDNGILSAKDIQQYTIQGILNNPIRKGNKQDNEIIDLIEEIKPLSKLERMKLKRNKI